LNRKNRVKLGQLIEFVAIISADSPNLIEAAVPISDESLRRYQHWTKLRIGDWLSRLDNLPRQITAVPALNRADVWKQSEPVLIDILAGGLVARVWGAVLTACDRNRHTFSAEKLAREMLAEQMIVQQRVLRLMVDGPYLTLERVVRLDRTRRKIERWSDLLAGHVIRRYGLADFAFDVERALDFGAEQLDIIEPLRESIWDIYFVCLRSNFPDVPLPGGDQAQWRDEIFRSILSSLSATLFFDDGRLRSVRLQRLLNSSTLPEGPPSAASWVAALTVALPGGSQAPRQRSSGKLGGSRISNQDM
jgi:hypothetical protein